MKACLADSGYLHMDRAELEEPYDGRNPHLRKGRVTWWIRFFDYL